MDDCIGYVKIFHGGKFVGPPLRYVDYELTTKYVDSDFTDLLEIRDLVTVELGYAEVSIRNIYYKGPFDEFDEVKALDGYASLNDICRAVEDDGGVEIYIDHQVAFGEVMLALEAGQNRELNDLEELNVESEDEAGPRDGFEGATFEENGTQGMDDIGGVTQEVIEERVEEISDNCSHFEGSGLGGDINEGPAVNATTSGERRGQVGKSKESVARAEFRETVRKYKTMSFEDEDIEALNDPPVDEEEVEGPEEEDVDEDSDGPNVLRQFEEDSDGEVTERVWQDVGYNPDSTNPVFKAGMKFKDHEECRKSVRLYARVNRVNIKQLYNDKRRQKFFCYKCPWMFMASADGPHKCFRLRKYCDVHKCQKTFKGKMVLARELALHFKKRLMNNPFYKVKDLQDDAWKELKFKLKWDKCVKAKELVLKELQGNFKEEYGLVEAYAQYLNSVNPGNNIIVVTGKDCPNGPLKFRKMYFCLGVIKEGWKNGCRPILGVDGCFLKSISKGVLLTAIGRDGNGGFYPVAWAVVESESLESWQWFFKLLQSDLDLGNGDKFTLISDQAQAILSASKNVFPKAEHRLCDRHIFCNVAKRHGLHDEDLRIRFWNACKATFEKQWEKEMVQLFGVSPGAQAFLVSMSLHQLVSLKLILNLLLVTIIEGSGWMRAPPPLSMSRVRVAGSACEWKKSCWEGRPHLGLCSTRSRLVKPAGLGYWRFIPKKKNYYRRDKWLKAYGKNIEVTRGPEMYNDWQGERPEPPITDRKAGRPRVNRMKPKGGEVKRVKVRGVVIQEFKGATRVTTCGICHQQGHNKRTCKNTDSFGAAARVSTSTTPPVAGPSNNVEVPAKRKATTQNITNKKPNDGKGKGKAKVRDP